MLNGKILAFALQLCFVRLGSYDSLRSKSHVALGSPLLLPTKLKVKVNGLFLYTTFLEIFINSKCYSFYIVIKVIKCVVFTIYRLILF